METQMITDDMDNKKTADAAEMRKERQTFKIRDKICDQLKTTVALFSELHQICANLCLNL